MRNRTFAAFALGALLLGGCATNALRLDYAGDVAARARLATGASRLDLGQVEEARIAANLDLVASDAACAPRLAYVFDEPRLAAFKDLKAPPRNWLCATRTGAGKPPETRELDLAPLDQEFEPTFALINAVAAYGGAIAAILDDKGPDPAGDIAAALAFAGSAQGLLTALGAETKPIPGKDDPRVAAVLAFVALGSEAHTLRTSRCRLSGEFLDLSALDRVRQRQTRSSRRSFRAITMG